MKNSPFSSTRFLSALLCAGSLIALLPVPCAKASTYSWSGAVSGTIAAAANWGGTAPGAFDTGSWNSATYTNAPSVIANMTLGEMLFDSGNTGGVTFGSGATTLTLTGSGTDLGVGINLIN